MTQVSQSESIVRFLAGLMPVYSYASVEGHGKGARSLIDGTLVLPICDATYPSSGGFEPDDGMVLVFWQGNQTRKSIVSGDDLVHLAIVKYAEIRELHLNGQESAAGLIRHMADHYTFKTGREIDLAYYAEDRYAEMLKLLKKLTERVGVDIVFDALQALFGRK